MTGGVGEMVAWEKINHFPYRGREKAARPYAERGQH